MNAENNFTFRQVAGGWIFASWNDERKEWSDEEVFTDSLGLVHRICEVVADCEPSKTVDNAINDRAQFLKDNGGKKSRVKPPDE
jgi:hypothetical protein